MKVALVDGVEVTAASDAPKNARCPVCEGWVRLRKRKTQGGVTWFYRHVDGARASRCLHRADASWNW